MRCRLGFPVDAGMPEASFIVIVNLRLARFHSCKGGGTSGLRENSGAALVFDLAPEHIRKEYRFEFETVPLPCASVRPDNLADAGLSDAAACALALAGYKPGEDRLETEGPLVLVSCAFAPHERNRGLYGVLLEKVARDRQGVASLRNKWEAARRNNALALVLHREDAALLGEFGIKALTLQKDIFRHLSRRAIPKQPIVISCASGQMSLLARELGGDPWLFSSENTALPDAAKDIARPVDRPREKRIAAASVTLVLAIGIALLGLYTYRVHNDLKKIEAKEREHLHRLNLFENARDEIECERLRDKVATLEQALGEYVEIENGWYHVSLVTLQKRDKLAAIIKELESRGFRDIEILPVKSPENLCVYFTDKQPEPAALRRKAEYVMEIAGSHSAADFQLKKVELAGRDRQIQLRIKE